MRRALVAGLPLCVVLLSGCLPDRDNPDDPVNRPTAVIAITKAGAAVAVTGRDEPVLLVSSNSTPADHGLLVTWSQRPAGADDDAWTPVGTPRVPITASVTFDPSSVTGFVQNGDLDSAAWELRATVEDPVTGGTDEKRAGLAVINDPPVFVGRTEWEFPPGGRWWTGTGDPFVVQLPAPVSNDDASQLTYSWTQLYGPEIAIVFDSDSGALQLPVPLIESESAFRVTVTDAAGASTSAEVRVFVREILWATTYTGNTTRVVAPPIDYRFPNDGDGQPVEGVVFATGDGVWTYEYGRDSLSGNTTEPYLVHRTHGMKGDVGYETILPTNSRIVGKSADPGGYGGWLAVEEASAAATRFYRVGDPANTPEAESSMPGATGLLMQPIDLDYDSLSLAAKENGQGAWCLRDDGPISLVELGADAIEDGALVLPASGAAGYPIGLAPGLTGDVWLLRGDAYGEIVPPPLVLERYSPGPTLSESRTITVLPPTALPRAFTVDPVSNRVAISGYRDGGGSPFVALVGSDGSLLFTSDVLYQPDSLSIDPRNGHVWYVNKYLLLAREYRPDGSVAQNLSYTTPPVGFVIDAETGARWIGGERLLRQSSFASSEPYTTTAITYPSRIHLDPPRARALVTDAGTNAVVALDSEAQVVARYDVAVLSTAAEPTIGAVSVDPDRGTVWMTVNGASASRLVAIPPPGAPGCGLGLPYDACVVPLSEQLPIAGIDDVDVEPLSGDVCVGGSGRVARFGADGTRLWSIAPPFDYVQQVAALPGEDGCAALVRNLNGGGSNFQSFLLRVANGVITGQYDFPVGASIGLLETGPGNVAYAFEYYMSFRYVLRVPFTEHDDECGMAPIPCGILVADVSQKPTNYVETFAVDPVYGSIYVGASGSNDIPDALLRFAADTVRTTAEDTLNAPIDFAVNH